MCDFRGKLIEYYANSVRVVDDRLDRFRDNLNIWDKVNHANILRNPNRLDSCPLLEIPDIDLPDQKSSCRNVNAVKIYSCFYIGF